MVSPWSYVYDGISFTMDIQVTVAAINVHVNSYLSWIVSRLIQSTDDKVRNN